MFPALRVLLPVLFASALVLPPGVNAQEPPQEDTARACPCPWVGPWAEGRVFAEDFSGRMEALQERLQEMARRDAPRLRAMLAGRVALGVEFQRSDDTDHHRNGVVLSGVRPDSPAAEADLQAGDRITHFDDHPLARPLTDGEDELDPDLAPTVARLVHLAGDLEEGDTVRLTVDREGRTHEVEIAARRLGPSPVLTLRFPGVRGDTIMVWPRRGPRSPDQPEAWSWGFPFPGGSVLGLRLHDLNEGLGRYFDRSRGALVLEVAEDAPLAVEAGDVITAIDGREVEDAAHAMRILRSYRSGEEVTVTVWREGREVRVEGRVP